MKSYFYIFLVLISFSLGFLLSEIKNRKEIFIQFSEIQLEMYLNYSFSNNDSSRVNQIDFGYNDKGFESWLLNIDEKDMKKVEPTFLFKKIICSQDWISLNYSSLNNKDKLLKQYKIFVLWESNGDNYILPVENIKTVFYD